MIKTDKIKIGLSYGENYYFSYISHYVCEITKKLSLNIKPKRKDQIQSYQKAF